MSEKWIARKTKFAIPASGWVGVFDDGKHHVTVPVVAWVYAEFVEAGPDFETTDGVWQWDGLGIWSDGPCLMSEFDDFQRYEPGSEDNRLP